MDTLCSLAITARSTGRDDRVKKWGGLTFCDFSSFYSPTAGGIRTYHNAKLEWFAAQERHRYVLIYPSHRFSVKRVTANVTIVTAYGAPVRSGYRLPVGVARVRALMRELKPDVLETGDPWFSGPFGLWFKESGYVRGPVSSFFHGDPLRTYVDPWVSRAKRLRRLRQRFRNRANKWFYQVQRLYDLTLASSAGVERDLHVHGVANVVRVPFGVESIFFDVGRSRLRAARNRREVRLLYAGRLQSDKGFDFLLATLPALLRRPEVTLTIAGTGPYAAAVCRTRHPRVRYLGYIASRGELAQVYAEHDVFLAPGRYETFGLAALEALAAGLVVVGPDEGGTGELMQGLDGPCLFRPDDRQGFLGAVERAIDGNRWVRARDGYRLASEYGTWSQAIGREVDTYCEFWSRSTT